MDDASIPMADPSVQLVADAKGRLYLWRGRRLLRSIAGIEAAELRRVIELADGNRSVEDICRLLSDEYDAGSIRALLEALEGSLLTARAVEGAPAASLPGPVIVLGDGPISRALLQQLARSGVACEGAAGPPGELRSRAAPPPSVVIGCLESGPGGALLEVNRAALAGGWPLLPIVCWGDEISVGPTTVPWKTACLECACRTAFLRTDTGPGPEEVLRGLRLGQGARPPAPHVVELVLSEALAELDRVRAMTAYPALIGRALTVDPAGAKTYLPVEATTECAQCHGANPEPVASRLADFPPPAGPHAGAPGPIRDRAAGVRSVDAEEARSRALAAFSRLNVKLKMGGGRLTAPYHEPLEAIPFFHAQGEQTFDVRNPVLLRSDAPENNFGKGITPEQAWCSGAYEWLERNLSRYHGGVRVLRAPYAEVRDQAIDMRFFVHGLLEPYDLPGRKPFDEREPMDWVWGHCLRRDRPILLPAAAVFLRSTVCFRGHRMAMPVPGSSGVAAGAVLQDALLQGLLEVVEHDAWFSAIRTGLPMPSIDLATITDPESRRLIELFQASGFEVLVRDLTNDFEIPTLQALIRSTKDYTAYLSPGEGSHFDPTIALRRALTEAYQFMASVLLFTRPAHLENSALSIFEMNAELHQQFRRVSGTKDFAQLLEKAPGMPDIEGSIRACVERIARRLPAADICMYDFSRPELPTVRVVRAFVSGVMNQIQYPPTCIPDRVLDYRRAMGQPSGARFQLEELYLGRLLA